MKPDSVQRHCDALITSLLRVKRGEVDERELVATLEEIKDSVDLFIRAAEFEVEDYGR